MRLIDSDGAQLGIVPFEQALTRAEGKDLDLVEVAGNATPTVCRIMDFHKYRYEQRKRTQESKRKSKSAASTVKEVKIRSRTEAHDLEFKTGHILRFLEKGHRVKISVFFKGREITRPEFGRDVLTKMCERIADVAAPEGTPRMEGRHMSLMVVPLKAPGAVKDKSAAPKRQAGNMPSGASAATPGTTARVDAGGAETETEVAPAQPVGGATQAPAKKESMGAETAAPAETESRSENDAEN